MPFNKLDGTKMRLSNEVDCTTGAAILEEEEAATASFPKLFNFENVRRSSVVNIEQMIVSVVHQNIK